MKITENVYMLDSVKGSHVFLITGVENVLIDTGMSGNAPKIIGELKTLGIDIKSVGKILLTHHDVDHIGSAKALQDASGAEVWAPAGDVPFITGTKKRPGFKRFVSSLMRTPPPVVTGTYDSRTDFSGIKAIVAPGHTPGHTIFLYGGAVFAGDLLQTRGGIVNILPGFMNWNAETARTSVGVLKILNFDWLLPAHGGPAKHNAVLDKFLEQF
jgi:glyoxylase-like metal-dependent hydrolase (beta-lactamase superfamily II)